MYKDFKSMLITGSTFSGKTVLISKYIDEVLKDENVILYLIDMKMVELFKYKDEQKVIYITSKEQIEEELFEEIKKRSSSDDNSNKPLLYIFVDEYAEVKLIEGFHKEFKKILKNKKDLNVEAVFTSQLNESFCPGMKTTVNTIVKLNRL